MARRQVIRWCIMEESKYDKETVLYCKDCLSLAIKGGRGIPDYCIICTSTNVGDTDIFEWEKMFERRYGYNYMKGKKKPEEALAEYAKNKSNGIIRE